MVDAIKARPDVVHYRSSRMESKPHFYGASSMESLFPMALNGAPSEGIEAMRIAIEKVETLERETDMPAFASLYDVTGADVDVARYLSGEPENMINYQLVDTPRAGRIINLVVSVTTSHKTATSAIRERGIQIVALALAIEKIGFQVELWTDGLLSEMPGVRPGRQARIRTRIKGPGEMMDPGRIVYAFTHASYFRGLGLAAMHLLPEPWHGPLRVGGSYGRPAGGKDDTREYPEGTVFIPSFEGSASKAANLVTEKLHELGIL
ncbi:hypothetical protein CRH09_35745 [Nocardia terpenica]|uniref:DUF7192 domain-containing protein n=2 Tax=Nocardia terpenica TaxID=455432 RepID=A0A291RU26_9NOCA|nr:hypothetical protein CRH09_35745 [Nocardia terpenica]